MTRSWDAVVVGAGPNGLAAACTLARAGRSVLVLEAAPIVGGGTRTESLTLPGFHHDVCSAIHPMGAASPVFRELDLGAHGLVWAHPEIEIAHPFEGARAIVVHRELEQTITAWGEDGPGYRALIAPLLRRAEPLLEDMMAPLRVPRRPALAARFGILGVRSAEGIARRYFRTDRARTAFGAIAAHAMIPLDAPGTAAFAILMLIAGHLAGWPAARGGSRAISDAMVHLLDQHGVEIRVDHPVRSLEDVPRSRALLLDLTPRQVLAITGDALPAGYRDALARFRYGAGSFKVDWALDGPIPWADELCRRAGTVHVAGGWDELEASERAIADGRASERPFVLVAQQSLFDPSRAPIGKHTGWAYCHVPHGSSLDMTSSIEDQIERFAPGFRSRILARHTISAAQSSAHDENLVGGDIGGGANDLMQVIARPLARWDPYSTPDPRLFLCSASTPPGGGVHGMCGANAARSALRSVLR